ncbi:unnamed protein product, partial [Ixodes pacificus]
NKRHARVAARCFRTARRRRRRFVDARLGWASWLVFSCLESRRRVVHRTLHALDHRVHAVHAATRCKQSGRASLAAGGLPRRQSPWGKLRRRARDAASDDTGDSPSTRRESGESSASARRLRRASRPPWQRSAIDASTRVPPGPRRPVCPTQRRPTTDRQRRMLTPRANGHERRLRFGRRGTARVIVFAGARSSPWPRVCLCRTGLRPTC